MYIYAIEWENPTKVKPTSIQINSLNELANTINRLEQQYGDTECGIYSLFFISHMLEDKFTENYLKTHILKDKYMQKFRKVYFNESLA